MLFSNVEKKKINKERNIIFNLLRGFYKQQGGEKIENHEKRLANVLLTFIYYHSVHINP